MGTLSKFISCSFQIDIQMALTDSQFTLTLASAALKLKLSGCMRVFVCLCARRNDLQSGFDALPKALQPSHSLPLLHASYFGRGNYFRYKRKRRFRVVFPLLSLPWIPPSLMVLANVILGGLLTSLVPTSFCTKFPIIIYLCMLPETTVQNRSKDPKQWRKGFLSK